MRQTSLAVATSRYRRRRPENTVLYQVVQHHLESFLAEACDEHGSGVPWFVERELRRFLECGLLAHGFARVRCQSCGHDRLVAFSCKGRAVCASCQGRRMAETAANLVSDLLPEVPYRQWTFTVPWRIRFVMAYDATLTSLVLRAFVQTLFAWQRRRARRLGAREPKPMSVTFLQRFGSALNLNLHFHSVLPDGVFVPDESGELDFFALPPPDDDEVYALLVRTARRIVRIFEKRDDQSSVDDNASWTSVIAEAIQPPLPAFTDATKQPVLAKSRCASVDGFSLHANVHVAAHDRAGLERLLRYGGRPPFSHKRLTLTPHGKVSYRLRQPWYTGQTHVVLEPVAFLRRLAMLIPRPRQNLVRFHGLLAPNAKHRRALLNLVPPDETVDVPPVADPASDTSAPANEHAAPPPRVYHRPWAELFRRVFAEDLLTCPRCDGRMRVIAFLTDPLSIRTILAHLQLPTVPPPIAPARAPPDPHIGFDESF